MDKTFLNDTLNNIINFWDKLVDNKYGGFYGSTYRWGRPKRYAVKGGILNSRILWFYSEAYGMLNDKKLLEKAKHAYEYLKNAFLDKEYGGLYWSVTHKGKPKEDTKHIYNQAFGIYALSRYYQVSKDEEALKLAYELFDLIESKGVDEYGYLEQFDRKFNLIDNEKLSENGLMAKKTMNTYLHLVEAYTVLYQADKSERVKQRLLFILNQFENKIYNKNLNRLEVFFDEKLDVIGNIHSFGHDIEGSWLLDRAAEVIGDKELLEKVNSYTLKIADNIAEVAYYDNSLANETDNGVLSEARVWWVQAEAAVGFYNAYQKTGDEAYLCICENILEFIKNNLISKTGEWYWAVDKKGKAVDRQLCGMWKCPYHNGRMCIELLGRMK